MGWENIFSRIVIDECHNVSHSTDYYSILLQSPLIKIGLTANDIKLNGSKKYNIFKNADGRFAIYRNDGEFKQQVKSQTLPEFINIIVEDSVSQRLLQKYTDHLTKNQADIVDSKGDVSVTAAKRMTIQCSGKILYQIQDLLDLSQLLSSRCIVYSNSIHGIGADIGVKCKREQRFIDDFNNGVYNSLELTFNLSDGINFKNVSNLIIFGIPTNYPKFKQIVGRVHRLGMDKPNVYYATTFNGLDHHIMQNYINRYITEYSL